MSSSLACALCALCISIPSRASADTELDDTAWHSSDCHFNKITFYSAIGVNLGWDGDETLLGREEGFEVSENRHTVTIADADHGAEDPVTDAFTGTYTRTADWTSGTLVGDHVWQDDSGKHEQKCSYTLIKRWTD